MARNIYSRFRRITTNQLYFPEIDGIRFLAIIMVILFHIHGYFVARSAIKFTDDARTDTLLNTFLLHGDRGVELFFVLSGFILCLPFAHHFINNGKKVSLKKYYLRRVTRLEPPYFIAITAIFLLHIAMHMPNPRPPYPSWTMSWLASLCYSHAFIYHRTPLLTVVAWSLEIEIQFYLLAPLLFRLLALHKITRRLILFLATIAIVVLQNFYTPPFICIYGYLQFFLAGVLLADLYVSNEAATLFNNPLAVPLAAIILIAICYMPVARVFYGELLFPFFIGILYYTVLKNEAIKKIFSYRFVPVIGGMCYSIYLLHYTIISILGRFTLRLHFTGYYIPNLILQAILLGIPILAISSVYYYYIERPFMSRKWLDMLLKKDKKTEETNMQANYETAATDLTEK